MKNYKNFGLDILKEITFEKIKTSYDILTKYLNGNEITEYKFTSKNNRDYSVYFMITEENDFEVNEKMLSEYTKLDEIPTIFFSLTDRGFGSNFDELVDGNEYLDVLGKVVYLIKEYMKKHNFKVYTIGEVSDKKQDFYNYYNKYFKDFLKIKGNSKHYKSKNCIYLIKDANRYNVDKIKLDENQYLKIK